MDPKYHRILLKLSGESLMGHQGYGIDSERLAMYAGQIRELALAGVEIGIVIGGGNIFRGAKEASKGMNLSAYRLRICNRRNQNLMFAPLERHKGYRSARQWGLPSQKRENPF